MTARPTTRQLEAFVAVATTLNFHDAARKLVVSQSALSAQVRDLEQALETRLFDRNRRGVRLTDAGRALLERARAVLEQLDGLHDDAAAFRAPFSGRLRLGVIPTVAPYLVPLVVGDVRARHPQLRLVVEEEQTRRLVERLHAGRVDLLLLDLDVALGSVETAPLLEERFVVALHRSHPLAKKARLTEADLRAVPVLLLEDGHCLRERALALCRVVGAREDPDLRASALHTLVQMVEAGVGVTLLPEIAVPVERRSAAHVVVRPLADEAGGTRRLGLAWRSGSERGEEYRTLASEWATAARALMEASVAPGR